MKKRFLALLLLTTVSACIHTQQTFSINEKTDKPAIEAFFETLRKSKAIYLKHGKISPEWISLSSEFQQKINDLKKDSQFIEIVPHANIFKLPVIILDKDKEKDFKNALAQIDPISNKVYYYDSSLVKKAFYALIHHHFVIVKQNEKYLIIFGTDCKNEAKKSALDSTKTYNTFVGKMSWRLYAQLAVLTATN
ncbi:MAG: hypothetical protein ACJAZS_000367 [Alteromonas naphthalenivorans]|jgi:hypothetical protein